MSAHKTKRGTWLASFRYTTWDGIRKQKKKEGFQTRREALEYEQEFLKKASGNCDMTLSSLVELYMSDCKSRLRPTSLITKQSIFDTHILPHLADLPINEITPAVIRQWQNSLLDKGFTDTYLKTINTQLSAVFNFAIKYYNIPSNPVVRCGPFGKKKATEMQIWTVDEFKQFYAVLTRPQTKMAFELFFWTGVREGELLALTLDDFNFDTKRVFITKSYARLGNEDVIQEPKTPKSNRSIPVPAFVLEHLKEYVNMLYDYEPNERLFPYTKSFFAHEMRKNYEKAGVKKIRIHDLRHSYASMLIEQGCEPLLVAELMGHEKVSTTMETYSHLYPDKHDEVLKKLENLK